MTNERVSNVSKVFVLRVWADYWDGNGRTASRRYILEDPFSRERRGFATLDELIIYLEALHLPKPE